MTCLVRDESFIRIAPRHLQKAEVTTAELTHTLQRLTRNKAPAPDNIHLIANFYDKYLTRL